MSDCCKKGEYSDFTGFDFCPFCAAPVKPMKMKTVINLSEAEIHIIGFRGVQERIPELLRRVADVAEKAINAPGFIRPAREWMATKGAK